MPEKRTHLSTRRFGLEIEFNLGRLSRDSWAGVIFSPLLYEHPEIEHRLGVGDYFHSNGSSWDLKADASCGMEVATPAITWKNWPQVETVCRTLLQNRAEINDNCGLHVHHEIKGFSKTALRRLVLLWGAVEQLATNMCNPTRRDNRYCQPLRNGNENWSYFSSNCRVERGVDDRIEERGRRTTLNLTEWWERGTAEFRLYHGTIDSEEIRRWVLFTQTIVELATRRIRTSLLDSLGQATTIKEQLRILHDIIEQYYAEPRILNICEEARQSIIKHNPNSLDAVATYSSVDFSGYFENASPTLARIAGGWQEIVVDSAPCDCPECRNSRIVLTQEQGP